METEMIEVLREINENLDFIAMITSLGFLIVLIFLLVLVKNSKR